VLSGHLRYVIFVTPASHEFVLGGCKSRNHHKFARGEGVMHVKRGAVIYTFPWIPPLISEMKFRRWSTGTLGLSQE
jgi:hypothetical protein